MPEKTADILKRIANKERVIAVEVDGETVNLTRPKADEYQRLLEKSVGIGTDVDSMQLTDAINLYGEILAASVDDLSLEDAKEIIIALGFDSELAQACIKILGTGKPDLDGASGKSLT